MAPNNHPPVLGPWSAPLPGERVLIDLRRHGIGLVGAGVRMVIITAVAGYLLGAIPGWLDRKSLLVSVLCWSVLAVALLLILVMVGRRFVRWARMHAALTDRRIVIVYGRKKQGWDIPLLTIVDVVCDSGVLSQRFDTGSLVIRTNFAHLPAVIPDVPHIGQVREAVLAARAQAWSDYQRAWSMPSPTGDVWAAS